MKRFISLFLVTGALSIASAFATVPSLINYQGRLTDSNGDPVVGSKNFTLAIYDASTAGNVLYTEDVGSVILDNKGIYSFQFGGTGTSSTATSEAVATTDGTATTFNKVLSNEPVITSSVSVADGTYTWDQTNGSSNDSEFGVIFNEALRRVTVIYYSGAPVEGVDITTAYSYQTTGISGALSSGAEHWMEISIDGVAQASRQRVLAVPFASRAGVAEVANRATIADAVTTQSSRSPFNIFFKTAPVNTGLKILPFGVWNGGDDPHTLRGIIGKEWKSLNSAEIKIRFNVYANSVGGKVTMSLLSIAADGSITQVATSSSIDYSSNLLKLEGDFPLDHQNYQYILEVIMEFPRVTSTITVLECQLSGMKTP